MVSMVTYAALVDNPRLHQTCPDALQSPWVVRVRPPTAAPMLQHHHVVHQTSSSLLGGGVTLACHAHIGRETAVIGGGAIVTVCGRERSLGGEARGTLHVGGLERTMPRLLLEAVNGGGGGEGGSGRRGGRRTP